CLEQPDGLECNNQAKIINDIIQSQIDLWTTKNPSADQLRFFELADKVAKDVATELQQLDFNGWGFVSNVDLVGGHSGSPLVDIALGEVVGIHRASDFGVSSFYSERRIHVDIRRVYRQ